MFYFITGIIVGLFVLINGIIKFKENKLLFLMSTICGLGLVTSGILGFIFETKEFLFDILLIAFAAIYIVYSLIAFKKVKK
jgi:hypothetical protein